jgi:hypothetical protein
MKKILLIAVMVSGAALMTPAKAQVSINVNIGAQPQWGPAGYDYAGYYYFPDMDVYYNVAQQQFIYFNAGRRIFAASLPVSYRNYDLYSCYKVVINDPRPYLHPDIYRSRYAPYRNRHDQVVIRDYRGRDNAYNRPNYDNRGHDRDDNRNWDRGNGRDNGHGHDKDKGHRNGKGRGHNR